ncbi:hypothetical protein SCHPADRAFT_914035 [Schizopora paradoxa]|uniref:Amine oxidase domain-containing protein n=1 Tax=Schizopora paradoxa TaxID=27342 RepID=A0A0H2RXK1_9AGAM|nr:hypothetical protein SCHPADRAFT_914035 [Schizopora paradoxa]
MILESLGLEFEILEGNDRLGGRLNTRKFGPGVNDYYDAGAMRFPNNPTMGRTFDLFKRLNFTPENGKLITYVFSTKTDVALYNNVRERASMLGAGSADVFGFSEASGGTVPQDFFEKGYQHWIDVKIDWLRDALKKDFEGEGWKTLMSVDSHSMRSYMALSDPTDPSMRKYPNSVINWCETLDMGTGMYDTALTEAVIDSLEFDYEDNVHWYAVQGGAEEIAKGMAKTLKSGNQPILNKRVTQIFPKVVQPAGADTTITNIAVVVDGESSSREYSHVISSIPLGMLRLVDTRACGFSYALNEAVRALRYDGSVKVAIKFTERWWEEAPYNQIGGQSKTDRPTRVVVYPSNGIGGREAVLLASYTWSQDAFRFGALTQGKGEPAEKILLDIILRDISDIHNIPIATLKGKVVDYDAWDWYHQEFSSGAFALFGPGQFRDMYPEVTKPAAGGLFHFAGEATSANHAWVVGALNSAYRCVKEILVHQGDCKRLGMLHDMWGKVGEVKTENLALQIAYGVDESTKLACKSYLERTKA